MAESRSDSEALRKYVLCSNARCANRLSREVRLLPCLHPCCKRCLMNSVANRGEQEEEVAGIQIGEDNFCCPKVGCEKRIPHIYLQQNEPAQLNRWLGELVQNLQTRDTLVRGEEPLCRECESQPAVAVCRHCYETWLCRDCERHHRADIRTRDHADDIVAIERLVEQFNDDPPRGLRTRPLRCNVNGHSQQELIFYCRRTRKLLCNSGMWNHHNNDNCRECSAVDETFLQEPDNKPRIETLKEDVRRTSTELQCAVNGVENLQRDLLQRKEDVEEEIEARKRELMQELERQAAELQERVATIYDTKLRRLNKHSETLTQIKEELERSAQFVTDFLDNYGPSPVEFTLLKDHIQTALEEILLPYQSHDHDLNCREDAILNYNPNRGLRQVGIMGSVSSSPDTENFVKDGPDNELRAKEVLHFEVTCRDAGGTHAVGENMPSLRARLVPNEDNLGAQPGSQDHRDAVGCVVTRYRSVGKYSISVFPPSTGPHCLWVYEDCPQPTGVRHIQGSPFDVQVLEPNSFLSFRHFL